MAHGSCSLAILLLLFLLQTSKLESYVKIDQKGVKIEVFLSPKIMLEPGLVSNKLYHNIDFPKGHIAIKSFNAELVDENMNSIPLHETYLHHWLLMRYYYRKGVNFVQKNLGPDRIAIKNSGICDIGLEQYFGLGAETRKTATYVPDPYGIEVGNPVDIPSGYEEGWAVNVHAIDTRGAVDNLACAECRCDFYNVTENDINVPKDYHGGVQCCHDETKCRVKEGFWGGKRSLYLRYTVKYVDWDSSIMPVKVYILDVSDLWTNNDESRATGGRHICMTEYDIERCPIGVANDSCVHTKKLKFNFPTGGDVIYGVGHQHAGAIRTSLYGEGGRVICSSNPSYGTGDEVGNEIGYVVGMSTCYPSPGSVKISAGEKLTLVSNYSNVQSHTGVMGLFYLLVADSSPKSNSLLYVADQARKSVKMLNFGWPIIVLGVVVFALKRSRREGQDYELMI